jgi:hypothetical protein
VVTGLAVWVTVAGSVASLADNLPPRATGARVAREWAWPEPDGRGVTHYGLVLTASPPPPGAVPALSATDAIVVLHSHDLAPVSGRARVTLRLATTTAGLDGGANVTGRLAWVVEYPEELPLLSVPPGLTDADYAEIRAAAACEAVVAVDAASGTVLAMVDVCHVTPDHR